MSDGDPISWPDLREEDRWLIEDFEQYFRETTRSPEDLRARAAELRQQAADTDNRGISDASLALASRYEESAAARTPTR